MDVHEPEDAYPLSPTQEGILFHCVSAGDHRMYLEQAQNTIEGDLDPACFQEAWRRAIADYPVLRTSFLWEGLKEPIQVVHRQVPFPFHYADWRMFSPREQQEQVDQLFAAERERGFRLTTPPLMRMFLFRTADRQHYFIWCYHHLLLDGWSVNVVGQTVFEYYKAITAGIDPLGTPPNNAFRDFIHWLRKQDQQAARDFWRRELQGFHSPTSLPYDFLPAIRAQAPRKIDVLNSSFDPSKNQALREWAKRHRLTLATLVQGAWALILSRYSGSSEALFGISDAGRPTELAGSSSMVGVFANTFPLRVRIDDHQPVHRWLQQLMQCGSQVREYKHYPLVDIQGVSELAKGSSLFDSLLIFENFPTLSVRPGDSSFLIANNRYETQNNYPLSLMVFPGERQWSLRLCYDTNCFRRSTIRRMLRHLDELLEKMLGPAEQTVGQLELLSEAARQQVLLEWNDTAVEEDVPATIHKLFGDQVARSPDKIAFISEDFHLSYRCLNHRAERLGRLLRARGVGPEVPVAVSLEGCRELLVGLLGILKAGGAFLPLDPRLPAKRLASMIKEAQPHLLVTVDRLRSALSGFGLRLVCLDSDWPQMKQQPSKSHSVFVAPENLAYVIFTSGSSGESKGVEATHGGMANRFRWMWREHPFTEGDVCCIKTSLNFVDSVWELFGPVLAGTTSVLLSHRPEEDIDSFVREVSRHRISRLVMVPSLLHVLLAGESDSAAWKRDLESVVHWTTSGEALSAALARRFYQSFPRASLLNLYGMSEASADSLAARIAMRTSDQRAPIGRPIANTQVYVLDSSLRPLPLGAAGEVCLSGAGLARGYRGDAPRSAERFVPAPFGEQEGRRLYRTGDRARARDDGQLEFLGRVDEQVKLHGQRIDLKEVEAALDRQRGVAQAVVTVCKNANGSDRLVAFVRPTADFSRWGLRKSLANELPRHMIPDTIVERDSFPVTPTGKLDRRRLASEYGRSIPPTSSFEAPIGHVESLVAGIWRGVLGIEHVGRHDTLLDLGGNSLLALRIVSRVARELGITLNPNDALHHTLSQFATACAGFAQGHTEGSTNVLS